MFAMLIMDCGKQPKTNFNFTAWDTSDYNHCAIVKWDQERPRTKELNDDGIFFYVS